MIDPFGARLRKNLDRLGPLCAGLDPHAALLEAWELPDTVDGLERFAMTVVEAVAGRVAVVKPQSAFFERHGSAGIAVLERAIGALRAEGTLVLLDVKRGDIGTTMQGYADAYLNEKSSLFVDAITVSPYLGFGSLRPTIDTALANGAGVFVLALTSNPEAPEVQQARTPDGRTVTGAMLAHLAAENAGVSPLGSVGAVVGATVGSTGEDFAVNGPLLAPGMGAQGGTAEGLREIFGTDALRNVLPSTSRELLSAGPSVEALRSTADSLNDSLATVLR
ncbi:orotidine-5'-phosphate decarboxylase [Tenggerimyces flavus]|uniref:Orotidine 5'-phosphate decarboxylase n=1 Tax=Tenggerimyces flavus TaxID=1708749 RepID=A0ABV7YED7_9ACTN|nr:orotidine-5'-phosphate decarboxylase [Tenggerimyces flavus]MBM7787965.1 orotidine 5'-phosphate decarboxylase subfamily 2 [Tenggerimyces flavus]